MMYPRPSSSRRAAPLSLEQVFVALPIAVCYASIRKMPKGVWVGFSSRKSFKIAPGVRLNVSKSGIGYSAGVKGYRVTKRADGRVQHTASIPGTGLSYRSTSGQARTRAAGRPAAPTSSPKPIKPGRFAPKGEKDLYEAVKSDDLAAIERVAQEHQQFAVAASSIAGLTYFAGSNEVRAGQLLEWVFGTGAEPAHDPFIAKYVQLQVGFEVSPGVRVTSGLDRQAIGLALAELYQSAGRPELAIGVVEQLDPNQISALSLAELYCETERFEDVVEVTNSVPNEDDATALLCCFRGVALRELGMYEASRAAFKEALKSKKREAVIRHRALLERARCYEAEGKRGMARKDLERIMAEDSSYAGLREALAALD